MHLRVTLERLLRRFGVKAQTRQRQIPYRETIRESGEARGRHKKQSGGHGQFGDVLVEITPRRAARASPSPRSSPAAQCRATTSQRRDRLRDYLSAGPLGFPVVDVAVV